jgi:hypothetical protein
MSRHLDRARRVVLDWIRSPDREPAFLSAAADSELHERHEEIAQRFLKWASDAGFGFEVVKVERDGRTTYEVHWTHRGASFVGFKQPGPESTAEDALLVGCAALLENDWCRERLPK